MDNKYKGHFNDKDLLEFVENNVTELKIVLIIKVI